RVRGILPQLGEMDLIIREPWVWKDRKWSMQAIATTTPFAQQAKGSSSANDRIPPKFEVANPTVDLGRHTQGETIEGKIAFVANHDEIRRIGSLQNFTGLFIGQPVWTTATEG